MSLRRTLMAAVAAFAGIASLATAASAGPWNLAPGEYYSELSGSFFSAGTFYDDKNKRLDLGGLYEQRTVSTFNELGWTKHMNFLIGVPLVSGTIRATSGPTLTNSGLGDITLGMRYGLHNGPSALALQLTWEAPTGLNAAVSPLVSDGLQKLEAGVQYGNSLGKRAFVQLGAGYRYDYKIISARKTRPTNAGAEQPGAGELDWSDHTVAQAALGIWLGGNLQVAGLYRGEFAGATGRQVLDSNNKLVDFKYETQLAGPRVTYRVDDKLDAFAGSWHTPSGRNSLHVDEYYVGVSWKQTKLNRLQGFLGGSK